jgi:hypothetical protein
MDGFDGLTIAVGVGIAGVAAKALAAAQIIPPRAAHMRVGLNMTLTP